MECPCCVISQPDRSWGIHAIVFPNDAIHLDWHPCCEAIEIMIALNGWRAVWGVGVDAIMDREFGSLLRRAEVEGLPILSSSAVLISEN